MNRKLVIALAVPLALVLAAAAYRHFALMQPLKERVLAKLNDPESAQFRNLKLYSDWTLRNSVLCGEVNAKNRLGGYVGFRSFQTIPWNEEVDMKTNDFPEITHDCDFASESRWWHPPV